MRSDGKILWCNKIILESKRGFSFIDFQWVKNSLSLWLGRFHRIENASHKSLRGFFSIIPCTDLYPIIKLAHPFKLHKRTLVGRGLVKIVNNFKCGQFFVDRSSDNLCVIFNFLKLQCCDDVESPRNILALLDSKYLRTDYGLESVSWLLHYWEPPQLPPVDLGPVQHLQIQSIRDFDPMGYIRALYAAGGAAEARLHQEDPFMNTSFKIDHVYYFISFLDA